MVDGSVPGSSSRSPLIRWGSHSPLWLAARVLPVVFGIVVVIQIAQWPNAEQHRQALLREIESVPRVAGALELNTESGSKPTSAIATKNYGSLVQDDVIAAHYKDVLGRAGWSLVRERETSSGREFCFARGDEAAALYVAGTSHPDWRYSLSLGWGSFDCK